MSIQYKCATELKKIKLSPLENKYFTHLEAAFKLQIFVCLFVCLVGWLVG
jgi:hypothetical protein